MKKGALIAGLFITAISIISAYGSYYSFSLGNLLDSFDPSTLILGLLFIIFLVLLKLILSRFFQNSEGAVNVMSLCIAALMIYGIHKIGWDYENFFYDLGVEGDMLYAAIPILLIIGLFYLAKSRKEGHFLFYRIFLILGTIAIALSFTDLVYEKGLMLIIGIILLLWGLWLWRRHRRKLGGYSPSIPNSYRPRGSLFKTPQRYQDWRNYRKQLRDQGYQQKLQDQQKEYERKQQQAQQQAQQIQKVKIRALNDLKQKYMSYLFAYYRKGNSPQQQMRMKQALATIIKMAAQQGCDANTFLSSRIGGSNAKSPNELR
ncbi:hypothetical protein HYT23_00620 [Candidatus Pacearchaeota archaeon]|nr:hypothetical protein [Candidatus Pacearchaeota archaeon]